MATYPILTSGPHDQELIYELPDGWTKRITQRKFGASEGHWDAYLNPPTHFKHKRLRSVIELMEFLIKNRDCKIDPRHVNMEKTPEIVTGSQELLGNATKKLMAFVEKWKTGAEVTVDEFVTRHKSKKVPNDGSSPQKRKYEKKKQVDHLRPELRPPPFTASQSLQLEKIFLTHADVPTPKQLSEWSSALNVEFNDVHDWFRNKWKARLEYEVLMARQKRELPHNSTDRDWSLDRPRPLRRFDVLLMHDPLDDLHDRDFSIANEDGEEDVVDSDDEDVDSNDDALRSEDCGEVTVDESVSTS